MINPPLAPHPPPPPSRLPMAPHPPPPPSRLPTPISAIRDISGVKKLV